MGLKKTSSSLVIILLLSTPVRADGLIKTADVISYGTVAAQVTFNTIHNWKKTDKKKALVLQGVKTFFLIAASESVKHSVHEQRPDKSDNLSFWSEHTGLTCVNDEWDKKWGTVFDIATAVGRIVAKKHNWWDTAAGCGAGKLINWRIK